MKIEALSLEQAVGIALGHNPALRAAAANLHSASSGRTQAAASYYPSLTATATLSRTDGAFVFNPDFPPRIQTYNNYSVGLQVTQTIFDFGKTWSRVSANGGLVDAAESDARGVRETVTLNAQLAYFGYMQARQALGANLESVDRATTHLKEAKAFYSVGRRAQLDVTRSEVDLANAEVNLIGARNQLRLAKLQLDNAMGIHAPGSGDYTVQDSFDLKPFALPFDSVKSVMFAVRPELAAARSRVDANRSLVTAAWAQHLPTISGFGTWTWSAFEFPLFSRGNAGVTLSLPIFQGFSISAQVEQAQASADVAQADFDALTESLLLEAEQNFSDFQEARERIGAASKLLDQAGQGLNLAEKQYAAGVGSAIEVSDAQLSLTNARLTRIQALHDYNSSLARLKRSMGVLAP